jgi:hypothetical protein
VHTCFAPLPHYQPGPIQFRFPSRPALQSMCGECCLYCNMCSPAARSAVCTQWPRPPDVTRLSPRQRDNADDFVVPASMQQPGNEAGSRRHRNYSPGVASDRRGRGTARDGEQSSTELLAGVAVPALTLMPGIVVEIHSMRIKSRFTA